MNFPMSKVAQTVCWMLTPISSPFLIEWTNNHATDKSDVVLVGVLCCIFSVVAAAKVAEIW